MFWKGAAVKAVAANLPVVHGPVQQGNAVLRPCFGEDIADVVIDGSFADRQSVRDLLIGQALCH